MSRLPPWLHLPAPAPARPRALQEESWGCCRIPGGPLRLPNSAGLVRYLQEKPQVGAGECFQGGPAPGVRRGPAQSEQGRPSLPLLRCPPPRLCPHAGRNDNHNRSCSCLITLRGTAKLPRGQAQSLIQLPTPRCPAECPGIYGAVRSSGQNGSKLNLELLAPRFEGQAVPGTRPLPHGVCPPWRPPCSCHSRGWGCG